MRLATTTADFSAYTSSQIEAMRYIREAGFRYVDYNFGMDYAVSGGAYADDWQGYVDGVLQEAERLGLQFVQAHAPMGFGTPIVPGKERDRLIAATKRSIEVCAALGIPNLVVHSGYSKGLTKAETFAQNKSFYLDILHTAEEQGITILSENFDIMCLPDYYWVDNVQDLVELIDYIDHPLLHACWDAGHGNMQKTPQDEALRLLGKHVYALHVQDNFGNADQHMAPYMGSLNLDSLMHGLLDIGYTGYFTFEACSMFSAIGKRQPFLQDTRLLLPPLALRQKAEELLYGIGEHILTTYHCFEE